MSGTLESYSGGQEDDNQRRRWGVWRSDREAMGDPMAGFQVCKLNIEGGESGEQRVSQELLYYGGTSPTSGCYKRSKGPNRDWKKVKSHWSIKGGTGMTQSNSEVRSDTIVRKQR